MNKNNVADTFVLLIPYEQDDILRPERFSPSLDILHNMGTAQSVTCFNFATKIEQQAHYYPRLSVTCHRRLGGYSQKLKIEFSAMKLINQPPNNLEEVCDEDFEEIIAVLQKRLFELGVSVPPEKIKKAQVVRVDYGKNCKVQINPALLLQEISKADISKRLDCSKAVYQNDGHALFFRCTNRKF